MVVYEKIYFEAYTNDQYIWDQNNTVQLYSILRIAELHWKFSSWFTDYMIFTDFHKCTWLKPTSCWKICKCKCLVWMTLRARWHRDKAKAEAKLVFNPQHLRKIVEYPVSWDRKMGSWIVFSDLCRCSMWTLNWILYEPIWKRCRFHFCFRTNINESLIGKQTESEGESENFLSACRSECPKGTGQNINRKLNALGTGGRDARVVLEEDDE